MLLCLVIRRVRTFLIVEASSTSHLSLFLSKQVCMDVVVRIRIYIYMMAISIKIK